MPLRRSLAFACFVLAALPAPCALAFERFTYVQTGALGFCPPIGAVFAAEVVQEAPGRYIAAVSILEAAPADAAGGSCLQLRVGLPAGTCARERKLAPRLLVGAEADRLEGRLEALFAQLEPGPAESCGLWDTCLEERVDLDGICATSGACGPWLLQGHCGIGLGGCAHPLSRTIRQEHLDALAARFVELGGLESCPSGVCDCAPPPPGASCQGARCVIEE